MAKGRRQAIVRGRRGVARAAAKWRVPGVTTPRSPGSTLPGAPKVLGLLRRAYKRLMGHVWPDPPRWWTAPVEEWIVYWWLKYRLRWEEDKVWYYQGRVYLPLGALFASKNFTQADFIVDLGAGSPAGMIGHFSAIVLDPFTEFTHRFGFDLERRDALERENYLLVFLAQQDLETRTAWVMGQALMGHDVSNRGLGR